MWSLFKKIPKKSGSLKSGRYRTIYSIQYKNLFSLAVSIKLGRNSSVGIANRYGLDGPEIEFRCGRDFRQRPWDPPSLLYCGYRVFPGSKTAGVWC